MDTGLSIQASVFLKTVGWPILAAGNVILLAWALGRVLHRDFVPHMLGLAIAAGVVAAQLGVRGVPHWPLADTLDWLGPVVTLAAAFGIGTDALSGRWQSVASSLAALVLALVASRLLLVPPEADASSLWLWAACALCALWLVTLATWSSPAPGLFGAWAGASAGTAVLLALSGSALLAQVLGAVAAVSSGLALLTFRFELARVRPSVVGPLVIAYGGVLAYALAFTEASKGPLVLAFLAPAASALGLVVRRPWLALFAAALLALVVTGSAVAWVAATAPEPYSPY